MRDYRSFRDQFAEAMDPRLYTIEFLDWLVAEGRAVFISTEDAALIIEAKTYPTGAKVGHALIAAGDLGDIEDVLRPQAEEWARQNGCAFAMVESRPGWAKRYKRHGYSLHQTTIIKEL